MVPVSTGFREATPLCAIEPIHWAGRPAGLSGSSGWSLSSAAAAEAFDVFARPPAEATVHIIADGGQVEEAERFTVTLADVKGGAEIGTQDAVVEIAGDGDPAGQFGFEASAIDVNESDGNVQVVVNRNYYSKGAISVKLTPVAGSATTVDFTAAPITLSWADGDAAPQTVTIPIVNDNVVEPSEAFTLELSNPTNGAVVGPHSRVVVMINDDDVAPFGGGGAFDWFALLCLGRVRWLRRRAFPETATDNNN